VPRRIVFSRSLYLPEAIEATAARFDQVATASISTNEYEVEVLIEADPGYGEELYDSFCNHALFETIVMSRRLLGGTLA
jgi:hypothetical protein